MTTPRWQYTKQRPKTDLRTAVHGHTKHQAAARHCSTCGCTPCPNPGFCRLCREADRKQAARPKHASGLPTNWDQMSFGELWDRLNDPRRRSTPQSASEAVMVAVRARGIAALEEPANIERLSRCDEAARARINAFIERMEKGHA
jgi:hypothetical protein